jgi:hypothetical protein
MVLGLSMLAFLASVAAVHAGDRMQGRLHDPRTGDSVGDIRQRGDATTTCTTVEASGRPMASSAAT